MVRNNVEMSEYRIIENPLEWQAKIDRVNLGLNMRGSARFWLTIAELTGLNIWRNGAPEFTAMVIELKEGLGILLSAKSWGYEPGEPDFTGADIEFRFVELDYKRDWWPVKEGKRDE